MTALARGLFVGALAAVVSGCVATKSATRGERAADAFYAGLAPADRRTARAAVQGALEKGPSGRLVAWSFPGRRAGGAVTPMRTFKVRAGHYCRDYRERLERGDGASRTRDATACRINGAWRLVDASLTKR